MTDHVLTMVGKNKARPYGLAARILATIAILFNLLVGNPLGAHPEARSAFASFGDSNSGDSNSGDYCGHDGGSAPHESEKPSCPKCVLACCHAAIPLIASGDMLYAVHLSWDVLHISAEAGSDVRFVADNLLPDSTGPPIQA